MIQVSFKKSSSPLNTLSSVSLLHPFLDLDYVVEIKPYNGLFNSSVSSRQKATAKPPQPPKSKVSDPPVLRMPRNISGTGSEVSEE